MNFKKTWKRANDGFTLVELIVVIAILAILAGIAVPAYSGYIKKANEAADHQVLAAVNTAFAAAVLENGDDFNDVKTATPRASTKSDGGLKITGIANPSKYNEAFLRYLSSASVETKVISRLKYEPGVGFVDYKAEGAKTTVTIGGVDYDINTHSLEAAKDSVYGENIEALQGQLGSLSGVFTEYLGEDGAAMFGPDFDKFVKEHSDLNTGDAAVLYVAEKAATYDAQQVGQMFVTAATNLQASGKTNPTMADYFAALPAGEGEDPLVNAALMYGAVVGYANSESCADPNFKNTVASVNDGSSLANVFTSLAADPGWATYLGTQEGTTLTETSDSFAQDMNGFLGAMDAIDSVSGGLTASDDLWNSEQINGILAELGLK